VQIYNLHLKEKRCAKIMFLSKIHNLPRLPFQEWREQKIYPFTEHDRIKTMSGFSLSS
jgi:hypothetical protein